MRIQQLEGKVKRIVIIAIVCGVLIAGGLLIFATMRRSNDVTGGVMRADGMNNGNDSAGAAPVTAAPNTVTISNFAFAPAALTVKTGTTITWINQDGVNHSIIADQPSSSAPSSPLFGKSATYTFTFKKAGTYAYHCGVHPEMQATITVTD
jgi:plastocyanin